MTELWIGITATAVGGLIGTVWYTLANRVEKVEAQGHDHEVRLARGDQQLQILHELRDEQRQMHDDILVIKSNCPKCKP